MTNSYVTAEQQRRSANAGLPIECFPLPVRTAPVTVSTIWHPRMDADLAHRWLRSQVRSACQSATTLTPPTPTA